MNLFVRKLLAEVLIDFFCSTFEIHKEKAGSTKFFEHPHGVLKLVLEGHGVVRGCDVVPEGVGSLKLDLVELDAGKALFADEAEV